MQEDEGGGGDRAAAPGAAADLEQRFEGRLEQGGGAGGRADTNGDSLDDGDGSGLLASSETPMALIRAASDDENPAGAG
jgi:hypothetical protein